MFTQKCVFQVRGIFGTTNRNRLVLVHFWCWVSCAWVSARWLSWSAEERHVVIDERLLRLVASEGMHVTVTCLVWLLPGTSVAAWVRRASHTEGLLRLL